MQEKESKVSYMFHGVGSEYYGMGQNIYDKYDIVKNIFKTAKEVTGIDFHELCMGADKSKIKETAFAQQALVCLCYSIYTVASEELGIKPDIYLGYSLGEYSALACAGMMKFEDALYLVQERADIIRQVSEKQEGTMAWVINIDYDSVEYIVEELQEEGNQVYISAYEGPRKVSVSGSMDVIRKVAEQVEDEGGLVIPIMMSGPFHSPLMNEAAIRLGEELNKIQFQPVDSKVIANYTGDYYKLEPKELKENLSNQLIAPILWYQSLEQMRECGELIPVEIGPKTVLQYIYNTNYPKKVCYTAENADDIQKLKEFIK